MRQDGWIGDRFAGVLHSINALVVALRRDGTIVFFNHACEIATGYTSDEAVGRRVWELLVAPDDAASEREALENASRHELFTEREVRWISKDGTPRTIALCNTLDEIASDGEIVIDTGLDVTDFRRTEAALHQAKTFVDVLKTIAAGANQASGVAEALEVCVDAVSLRTPWKRGRAYLVRDGRMVQLAERDRRRGARGEAEDEDALAKRSRLVREPIRRNHGPPALAFPIRFGDDVIAVLCFVADGPVDPEDRLVEILSDAAVRIGRVVERNRADEERARLLEREQAALAAAHHGNVARDLFLAAISHELRTPLTSILAWTQLLRGGSLDADRRRRALATIEENARAQGALIDDLLDISRIILGKLTLEPRTVDPVPLVREAIESMRPAADARGIAIVMREDREGRVFADPARLRQVVLNLLSNAVKFSNPGGVITVRLGRAGRAGYRIAVEDRGIGIRPEYLARLFEPFSQADASSTRSHGGLGLGLAIANNLVEMQGGRLRAESAGEGRGATFTIELPEPRAVEPRPPERAVRMEAPPAITARDRLKGVHVLVVDDVADSREALSMILSSFGADVVEAGSACEAFDALGRHHPDVLVTDIAMPGEDGYSLLRRIRSSAAPELREIPSVALTAYAGREDHDRAVAAGFQAHIAKPIDVDQTVEIVARLARPSPS